MSRDGLADTLTKLETDYLHDKLYPMPRIVTLCGSTRFSAAYQQANFDETLAGRIVLTIGCDMKADSELFGAMTIGQLADTKTALDRLHLQKILISDEILVLNVGDYIGESTRREIEFARSHQVAIRYLEPHDER